MQSPKSTVLIKASAISGPTPDAIGLLEPFSKFGKDFEILLVWRIGTVLASFYEFAIMLHNKLSPNLIDLEVQTFCAQMPL